MLAIRAYSEAATMEATEFARRYVAPFLVFTGANLRALEPGQTRGLTVDRLVIQPPSRTAAIADGFLVAEITARDPSQRVVTIGASSSCDLTIDDASVSNKHGWFDRAGDQWRIWDNDSATGTHVNGVPVVGGRPHVLAPGDRLTLGYVDLTFLPPDGFHQLVRGLLR